MKTIPQWPKMRWCLRRNGQIGGIILQGVTVIEGAQISIDQCISHTELDRSRFPFLYWCREERKRIRHKINSCIIDKVSA